MICFFWSSVSLAVEALAFRLDRGVELGLGGVGLGLQARHPRLHGFLDGIDPAHLAGHPVQVDDGHAARSGVRAAAGPAVATCDQERQGR